MSGYYAGWLDDEIQRITEAELEAAGYEHLLDDEDYVTAMNRVLRKSVHATQVEMAARLSDILQPVRDAEVLDATGAPMPGDVLGRLVDLITAHVMDSIGPLEDGPTEDEEEGDDD